LLDNRTRRSMRWSAR